MLLSKTYILLGKAFSVPHVCIATDCLQWFSFTCPTSPFFVIHVPFERHLWCLNALIILECKTVCVSIQKNWFHCKHNRADSVVLFHLKLESIILNNHISMCTYIVTVNYMRQKFGCNRIRKTGWAFQVLFDCFERPWIREICLDINWNIIILFLPVVRYCRFEWIDIILKI